MKVFKTTFKKSISWIMVLAMIVTLYPSNMIVSKAAVVADTFVEQPGGDSTWRVTGNFNGRAGLGEWNNGNDWSDKNYGNGGDNLKVDLEAESIVVFTTDITNPETNQLTYTTIKPLSFGADNIADSLVNQPGADDTWVVAGSFQKQAGETGDWNNGSSVTQMKHLVENYHEYSVVLNSGSYEFKIVKKGSWDGMSDNVSITLNSRAKVNFYVKEVDNKRVFKVYSSVFDAAVITALGDKYYNPATSNSIADWPRLVGSIQLPLEEGSWNPDRAKQYFVDYNFDGTVWKIQRTIPIGSYESKVLFGNTWTDKKSYGTTGDAWDATNLSLNVLDEDAVVFTLDISDGFKSFTHNYRPKDTLFDGKINSSALYFDSRSITYKKPFGAVRQESEDVTFRIRTAEGDAQLVRLELINESGVSEAYDMSITTVLEGNDYWEVKVPQGDFDEIGIWGYKFIVIDGATKIEYGAANQSGSGGIGRASDSGQTPYNLSVYAKDFITPDWMKEAVVYQIFVDRFFDGDQTNNRAKTIDGYRGSINPTTKKIETWLLQYFDGGVANDPTPVQVWGDWDDYPENPRHADKEHAYKYPDSKTDTIWTNEFYGGDIQGVWDKIDYLKTLGVTAIYLNPVSWAASNHKYDATDYHHLDPMFGEPVYNTPGDPKSGLNYAETRKASDAVYFAFAQACYDNDIKIIVDGVFNHVGDDSIYFDRYEKYPEIGAYEYWKRVWDEVEKTIPSLSEEAQGFEVAKNAAEATVKAYYKSLINPQTGNNYTDDEFNYTTWFTVGPQKNADGIYKYEAWWGFDSLPAVDTVEAAATNLTNDSSATIAGNHEYNNIDFRDKIIGYDLNKMTSADASTAIQEANSQRWMWMGSSGWRLDVAPDVSDETWVEFRKSVKSVEGKKDVNNNSIADPLILGEEWGVATHYLLGDMFDSVMNYQFRSALQSYLLNGDAKVFNERLETIRENYPKEAWEVMLNLVDSHDTVRNITKMDEPTWEEENIAIAKEASDNAMKLQALTAIFQMSYPGAPTIYYGDEVAVTGTKDPDSRRSFPWERISESNGTYTAVGKYSTLFNTYVNAAAIRNDNGNLFTTGDMKLAYANDNIIAYARKNDTKGGLVVINQSEKSVTIEADVRDFIPEGTTLKDMLGGTVASTVDANGKLEITIPALTGMMMVSTTTFATIPNAPENLTATAIDGRDGSVELSWNAVADATGYEVYRTLLEGMEVVKIGTVTAPKTTLTDENVTNGTRYYYYVKTVKNNTRSLYSKVATALPSYLIDPISKPTQVSEMTIGFEIKTEDTEVIINIPGLTDNVNYAEKDVKGLKFTLVYYLDGELENAKETKLRYKNDAAVTSGGAITAKAYTAYFEPTESGDYKYYAKATVNNGLTYVESDEQTMTANPGADADVEEPVLEDIIDESNRVTLDWTVDDIDSSIKGFDIYRMVNGTNKFIKIDTVGKKIRQYVDFSVKNDTTYIYKVAAFDVAYNRGFSEQKTVTPKLVMVDVTLKLNIPSYTPKTDDIYIAGDPNGWNASGWKMGVPSGATTRDVVEYTFKMMAGKQMEYKFTRGSWQSEAYTSKNPLADVPEQYAYSTTETNIKLTVTNQGGNKMLVEETVLRWVDMPLMVILPRASYFGEDIVYSTTENTFDLMASVPWGAKFTMDGKDINQLYPGAMDQYGNVEVDDIPLKPGLNTIELHIEPTAETFKNIFKDDVGAANKATKTVTMKITTPGGGTPTTPTTPTVPAKQIEEVPGVTVEKTEDGKTVIILDTAGEVDLSGIKIGGELIVKGNNVIIKNLNTSEPLVITGNNVTIAKSSIKGELTVTGNNAKLENVVSFGKLEVTGNNVVLSDSTINADITISGNKAMIENTVFKNEVLIEGNNTTISGSTINKLLSIKGGVSNTVNLTNTAVTVLAVNAAAKNDNKFVILKLSGNTVINRLDINSAVSIRMPKIKQSSDIKMSSLQTQEIVPISAVLTPTIKNTVISVPKGTIVSLRGNYNKVTMSSAQSKIKLKLGQIQELVVKKTAVNSKVILSNNTEITKYTLAKNVSLKGKATKVVNVASTKVKLNNKAKDLALGKKFTLKTTLTPKVSNDAVTFKSSNKKVATVTKKGVVKAVSKGKAVITVTTSSGKKVKCTVTVK